MSESKLEQLKKQQAALKARIQKVEAQTRDAEHKKDTRRKILLGAYYLDQAPSDGKIAHFKELLDPYLTRNSDRALFNLDPLPHPENKEETTA